MRVTCVVMLLCHCTISSLAQTISLHERRASLVSVLNKISKQTGYDYIGSKQLFQDAKPVTIVVDGVSLKKALDLCLAGQSIRYKLTGQLIILQSTSLPPPAPLMAPKKVIPLKTLITYRGRVLNENEHAMAGCSIKAVYGPSTFRTDSLGRFSFEDMPGRSIAISYVGYETILISAEKQGQETLIKMKPLVRKLDAVEVFSADELSDLPTTYASGNVEVVNTEQLQKGDNSNLSNRLEMVSSGPGNRLLDLTSYNGIGADADMLAQKHFLSGIDSETRNKLLNEADQSISLEKGQPLIVVDGIPSFYTIDMIDPDQIASLSILKAAPASAIWGFRAADGAILISTKKNRYKSALNITANGKIMFSGLPRLLYKNLQPVIDGQDGRSSMEHVVNNGRLGRVFSDESSSEQTMASDQNMKNNYPGYQLRNAVQTHFDLSIGGATENFAHQFYAGYGHFLNSTKYSSGQYSTLNYSLFSKSLKRLRWHGSWMYNDRSFGHLVNDAGLHSYLNPMDERLRVAMPFEVQNQDSISYLATQKGKTDANLNYQRYRNQQFNSGIGFSYNIFPWLSFNSDYNYSYGSILRQYDDPKVMNRQSMVNQSLKHFINATTVWREKHSFSAMLGGEFVGSEMAIDGNAMTPQVWSASVLQGGKTSNSDKGRVRFYSRTFSAFSNLSYSYDRKYTFAVNMRADNVAERDVLNKHTFPFYALQGFWNIGQEGFYQAKWLPKLNLTVNYSHGSNSILGRKFDFDFIENRSTGGGSFYNISEGIPTIQTLVGKVKTLSMALNFGNKNGRISGTLEYIVKNTDNLHSSALFNPLRGFAMNTPPFKSLRERTMALRLNTENVRKGKFSWMSGLLFNHTTRHAGNISRPKSNNMLLNALSAYGDHLCDDPAGLYAFKFAGYDPKTGSPRGYFNGEVMTLDNGSTTNAAGAQAVPEIKYCGSGIPLYYGTLMNTFSYGAVSLSVDLLYKFGYYFRKPVTDLLNYKLIFGPGSIAGDAPDDISKQMPGNESLLEARNQFYSYSEMNVLRADHIRLKDINLSYAMQFRHGFLKKLKLYAEAYDLGVIWAANKYDLDPDFNEFMKPQSYALGFSAGF